MLTSEQKFDITLIIASTAMIEQADINETDDLLNDLGLDDLDKTYVLMDAEQLYDIDIKDVDWAETKSVKDLYNVIEKEIYK